MFQEEFYIKIQRCYKNLCLLRSHFLTASKLEKSVESCFWKKDICLDFYKTIPKLTKSRSDN